MWSSWNGIIISWCLLFGRVHGISKGSVTVPQIKWGASARVSSHLSLLSKAPTLFLGILLKSLSFLLPSLFPAKVFRNAGCFCYQFLASRFPFTGVAWTLVSLVTSALCIFPGSWPCRAAPVFGCGIWVPRAPGIGVIHMQNLEHSVNFFLPSRKIFCNWFLSLKKNNALITFKRFWGSNFLNISIVLNKSALFLTLLFNKNFKVYLYSFLIIQFWIPSNFSFPKSFYGQLITEFISCLKL